MITLLIAQNGQDIKGQKIRGRNMTSTNTCLNPQLLIMSLPDGALSKVMLTNIHQYTKEFKYDRQHMPVWQSSFLGMESNQKYC